MGFGKFLGFVVGGAAAIAAGVILAPAIGAAASLAGLGAAAGSLSGAAASSAGLAALGGGSVAAGGMGMAGGTALVSGAAGLVGGSVAAGTVGNFSDSFIDNVLRDRIDKPLIGSVVYCDLPVGEHSGVYVGWNKIVHLEGDGVIRKVSPKEFLERLGGFNNAISIYISCSGKHAVGSKEVAELAKKRVGSGRNYNLIIDNCHQFSSGCLSGDFGNSNNFLWMLKDEASRVLGANCWRVWNHQNT